MGWRKGGKGGEEVEKGGKGGEEVEKGGRRLKKGRGGGWKKRGEGWKMEWKNRGVTKEINERVGREGGA